MERIIASGIDRFWDLAYFTTFDRRTRKVAEEKARVEGHGVEVASMRTSLKSFFQLYLVLLSIGLLSFCIELYSKGKQLHIYIEMWLRGSCN